MIVDEKQKNDRFAAEVDFFIRHEDETVPIQVKIAENTKAKSFKLFNEKYNPQTAICISLSDYRKESWMTNVPHYIVGNYF